MNERLTYDDFLQRLNIQTVLQDMGYQLHKRDGLRWPSYVRLNEHGERVRGDKFIVTASGKGCFRPPEQKVYNVISLIKEFPDRFREYNGGVSKDRLVNQVCNRLLNNPVEERRRHIIEPKRDQKPFNINDYKVKRVDRNERDSIKPFYPYFKPRGIDIPTQYAFSDHFILAARHRADGKSFTNLSFPIVRPSEPAVIVGLEERGRAKAGGSSGYKGKAEGSNASEGLWIANLNRTSLGAVPRVFWFESAFDAMAHYQLHKDDRFRKDAVYVSTGGSPTERQFRALVRETGIAEHHLCFDNDEAGRKFSQNFRDTVSRMTPREDMREYLESCCERGDVFGGNTDLLPKDIGTLFGRYETLMEEYLSSKQSGLVCREDLDDIRVKLDKAYDSYADTLKTAGRDFSMLEIVRDLPDGPYKDWNDQLLGKVDARLAQEEDLPPAVQEGVPEARQQESKENDEEGHRGFHR